MVNQNHLSQSRQRQDNIEYKEVTKTIIGCAYRVYNKMGFGFLESVYEKCLLIELHKSGLDTESQKPITVYYEGEIVGKFVAELRDQQMKKLSCQSCLSCQKTTELLRKILQQKRG